MKKLRRGSEEGNTTKRANRERERVVSRWRLSRDRRMKRKREKSGIFKEREKLQRKEKGLRDQKGEGEEEE